MGIIKAADILLPTVADMGKWSVIACDQFTSDRGYWEETHRIVGDAPSTLHMILPEALMGSAEAEQARDSVSGYMHRYLSGNLFRELRDSFVSVERRLEDGTVRHGIVAAVDLDAYEYRPEKEAKIKATEHTVEERLWKRIELRETAELELPHVLVFYEDPEGVIEKTIRAGKEELPPEYDFELMQRGGHIKGRAISGEKARELERLLNEPFDSEAPGAVLAVGDGNHSLATAKLCWERRKAGLTEEEKRTHKARFALVELVNLFDGGIHIEPIHRVVSGTDAAGFVAFAEKSFQAIGRDGAERAVTVGTGSGSRTLPVRGLSPAQTVDAADRMIAEYLKEHGGAVDYIHDEASAVETGSRPDSAYILLPAVEKEEIFEVVRRKELFPKKCFSIGNAREKRYYLECRTIR